MRFRHLVLLAILVGMGLALQQFTLYLSQWDRLQTQRSEVIKLTTQIEDLMRHEASLQQQLQEAERLHAKLRRLLPETLQEEELERRIAALADKHQIKILASKTAVSSRPGYNEATIDITLEASVTAAHRFMRELKSIPRRIHIIPPEKRGKKSIHLFISIYAVGREEHETTTLPRCGDVPSGVWLPPLQDRLKPLYEEYSKQCRFVSSYAEHYRQQQRLLALQKENARLQALEKQLRIRP